MTQAIILSGGKGTRLMPLTKDTPKPMLPIQGKPHLEYIIQLLKKHGVTDIIFSTGYLHNKIVEYFGNGHNFGVNIKYKEDGETPLGTAGAIKNCEELLNNEPFLVINGDILTNINISEFIFHNSILNHSGATIALTTVRDVSQYGLAITNNVDFNIYGFIEKPSPSFLVNNLGLARRINAGIYILTKSVLEAIPSNKFKMIETDIFPMLVEDNNLFYYHNNDMYWIDIGTFDRYDIANKDVRYGYFKI